MMSKFIIFSALFLLPFVTISAFAQSELPTYELPKDYILKYEIFKSIEEPPIEKPDDTIPDESVPTSPEEEYKHPGLRVLGIALLIIILFVVTVIGLIICLQEENCLQKLFENRRTVEK
jgi:hypothetical protein